MNIKDIASMAGCSTATVSRVINNQPGVKSDIKEKIERIITENDYRPNLIARGLVEMERFGKYFEAHESSFLGLSGAGDLFLTASSTMSRNFRVGLGLALNKNLEDILLELGEVAEGVKTADAIYKVSIQHQIYTPIAKEVKLILDGKNPKDSLKDLLKS